MARRWDPAVQERLHKLFAALGKEFDGRIAGINLAETFGRGLGGLANCGPRASLVKFIATPSLQT